MRTQEQPQQLPLKVATESSTKQQSAKPQGNSLIAGLVLAGLAGLGLASLGGESPPEPEEGTPPTPESLGTSCRIMHSAAGTEFTWYTDDGLLIAARNLDSQVFKTVNELFQQCENRYSPLYRLPKRDMGSPNVDQVIVEIRDYHTIDLPIVAKLTIIKVNNEVFSVEAGESLYTFVRVDDNAYWQNLAMEQMRHALASIPVQTTEREALAKIILLTVFDLHNVLPESMLTPVELKPQEPPVVEQPKPQSSQLASGRILDERTGVPIGRFQSNVLTTKYAHVVDSTLKTGYSSIKLQGDVLTLRLRDLTGNTVWTYDLEVDRTKSVSDQVYFSKLGGQQTVLPGPWNLQSLESLVMNVLPVDLCTRDLAHVFAVDVLDVLNYLPKAYLEVDQILVSSRDMTNTKIYKAASGRQLGLNGYPTGKFPNEKLYSEYLKPFKDGITRRRIKVLQEDPQNTARRYLLELRRGYASYYLELDYIGKSSFPGGTQDWRLYFLDGGQADFQRVISLLEEKFLKANSEIPADLLAGGCKTLAIDLMDLHNMLPKEYYETDSPKKITEDKITTHSGRTPQATQVPFQSGRTFDNKYFSPFADPDLIKEYHEHNTFGLYYRLSVSDNSSNVIDSGVRAKKDITVNIHNAVTGEIYPISKLTIANSINSEEQAFVYAINDEYVIRHFSIDKLVEWLTTHLQKTTSLGPLAAASTAKALAIDLHDICNVLPEKYCVPAGTTVVSEIVQASVGHVLQSGRRFSGITFSSFTDPDLAKEYTDYRKYTSYGFEISDLDTTNTKFKDIRITFCKSTGETTELTLELAKSIYPERGVVYVWSVDNTGWSRWFSFEGLTEFLTTYLVESGRFPLESATSIAKALAIDVCDLFNGLPEKYLPKP